MPQHMSRLVVGILFSTFATASFAGNTTTYVYGTQQDGIEATKGQHDESPQAFGQYVASGGSGNFTNLGDFLRCYTGKARVAQNN